MPRIAAAFFLFGILCVLAGMLLGMQMGASENMTLAAAHAHLNLVGWATMALYGTFYTLTRHNKLLWLPRINFALSAAGTLVMVGYLSLFLSHGNDPKYVPGMIAGEVLTFLGALAFAYSVVREMFRKRHGLDHHHDHGHHHHDEI
ncbi:MAG TPA: hypothetical protein VG819_03395 [Rhizomicrobium sp.]|jgi:hypothetical protein|nr:hypothetical protein [Rhizomicrobium sp.]